MVIQEGLCAGAGTHNKKLLMRRSPECSQNAE
jgi:hypothetical protein